MYISLFWDEGFNCGFKGRQTYGAELQARAALLTGHKMATRNEGDAGFSLHADFALPLFFKRLNLLNKLLVLCGRACTFRHCRAHWPTTWVTAEIFHGCISISTCFGVRRSASTTFNTLRPIVQPTLPLLMFLLEAFFLLEECVGKLFRTFVTPALEKVLGLILIEA